MTRIESIAPKPDRAGRHLVKLSENVSLRLYPQTVEDFCLYPGRELSQEEMEKLLESAGAVSAKMRAVRIVSAANVSQKDLLQRLVQKGETPEHAREAVQWLQDMKLLDDAATARQVVQSCVAKGYGMARAKQALYEKRIPKEYWEDALQGYPDQSEKIISYLKSKITSREDPREVKRAVDALIRRGHSYSLIRSCLTQLNLQNHFREDD